MPDLENPIAGAPSSPISVADIMNNLQEANVGYGAALRAVTGAAGAAMGGASTVGKGANLVAEGEQAVNAAVEAAKMRKIAADNAVMAMFGTMPGAPSAQNAAIAASIIEQEQKITGIQDDISKRLSVGFFDNPIEWLQNQLTVPFIIDQGNAEVASLNQKVEYLHKLAAATTDQVAINAATASSASAEELVGLNKIAAGKAIQELGRATMQAASVGVSAAGVMTATTQDKFNALVNSNNTLMGMHHAVVTDMQADASLRAAALANETGQVELIMKKIQSSSLQEQEAGKVEYTNRLAKVTEVYGLAPLTYSQWMVMPDNALKKFLAAGVENPDVQSGRIAADPATALSIINNRDINLPMNAGANIVREALTKIAATVANESGLVWKNYTPDQQVGKINERINAWMEEQSRNIPDTGGVYSPASLMQVLSIPAVGATSLAATLAMRAPPTADVGNTYPFRANDVIADAMAQVNSGKATPARMAAEISQIYNAVMLQTNQVHQFTKFAVPGLSASTTKGYRTAITTNMAYGSTMIVDMTNPAAVEAALIRAIRFQGDERIYPQLQ